MEFSLHIGWAFPKMQCLLLQVFFLVEKIAFIFSSDTSSVSLEINYIYLFALGEFNGIIMPVLGFALCGPLFQ
jgi:hypothetical protein